MPRTNERAAHRQRKSLTRRKSKASTKNLIEAGNPPVGGVRNPE